MIISSLFRVPTGGVSAPNPQLLSCTVGAEPNNQRQVFYFEAQTKTETQIALCDFYTGRSLPCNRLLSTGQLFMVQAPGNTGKFGGQYERGRSTG